MRVLIITVLVVLTGVLGVLAAGSQMEATWQIQRSQYIAAPPADVFAVVCNLHTWPQWLAWGSPDTAAIEYEYTGRGWGRGATQSWHNEAKMGQREITEFTPGQRMQYVQTTGAVEGPQANMQGFFSIVPENNGSRLQWTLSGQTGSNPVDKLLMYLYRSRIIESMGRSLNNLAQRFAHTPEPGA